MMFNSVQYKIYFFATPSGKKHYGETKKTQHFIFSKQPLASYGLVKKKSMLFSTTQAGNFFFFHKNAFLISKDIFYNFVFAGAFLKSKSVNELNLTTQYFISLAKNYEKKFSFCEFKNSYGFFVVFKKKSFLLYKMLSQF
jgi:hypothetical protein